MTAFKPPSDSDPVPAPRQAAMIATADKLRTMAAELEDLAADLRGFPTTASRCARAASHLRHAGDDLAPRRKRGS